MSQVRVLAGEFLIELKFIFLIWKDKIKKSVFSFFRLSYRENSKKKIGISFK